MGRTARVIALLALGIVIGIASAVLVLLPMNNRLSDEVFLSDNERKQAEHDADSTLRSWGVQMGMLVQQPEPQAALKEGVFLARVVNVEESGALAVDWLGSYGTLYGDDRNDWPSRQRLTPDAFSMVHVQTQLSERPDDFAAKPIGIDTFPRRFNAQSTEGERLRDASWWVTFEGGYYLQLIEAPVAQR